MARQNPQSTWKKRSNTIATTSKYSAKKSSAKVIQRFNKNGTESIAYKRHENEKTIKSLVRLYCSPYPVRVPICPCNTKKHVRASVKQVWGFSTYVLRNVGQWLIRVSVDKLVQLPLSHASYSQYKDKYGNITCHQYVGKEITRSALHKAIAKSQDSVLKQFANAWEDLLNMAPPAKLERALAREDAIESSPGPDERADSVPVPDPPVLQPMPVAQGRRARYVPPSDSSTSSTSSSDSEDEKSVIVISDSEDSGAPAPPPIQRALVTYRTPPPDVNASTAYPYTLLNTVSANPRVFWDYGNSPACQFGPDWLPDDSLLIRMHKVRYRGLTYVTIELMICSEPG